MTNDQKAFAQARAALNAGGSIMVSQNDTDLFPPGEEHPTIQRDGYCSSGGGNAPDPSKLRAALEELVARDRGNHRDLGVPPADVDETLQKTVDSWTRNSTRYTYGLTKVFHDKRDYYRIERVRTVKFINSRNAASKL